MDFTVPTSTCFWDQSALQVNWCNLIEISWLHNSENVLKIGGLHMWGTSLCPSFFPVQTQLTLPHNDVSLQTIYWAWYNKKMVSGHKRTSVSTRSITAGSLIHGLKIHTENIKWKYSGASLNERTVQRRIRIAIPFLGSLMQRHTNRPNGQNLHSDDW